MSSKTSGGYHQARLQWSEGRLVGMGVATLGMVKSESQSGINQKVKNPGRNESGEEQIQGEMDPGRNGSRREWMNTEKRDGCRERWWLFLLLPCRSHTHSQARPHMLEGSRSKHFSGEPSLVSGSLSHPCGSVWPRGRLEQYHFSHDRKREPIMVASILSRPGE